MTHKNDLIDLSRPIQEISDAHIHMAVVLCTMCSHRMFHTLENRTLPCLFPWWILSILRNL